MRHERLRFYWSGLVALVFFWGAFRGLEWIVNRCGIATRVHYSPAKEHWIQIGESWQLVEFTVDLTGVGHILLAPALALTYYFARTIYFLDIRRAFPTRRDIWIVVGWMVGPAAIIAEYVLLEHLSHAWGLLQRWPTATPWVIIAIVVVSSRLVGGGWAAMMRRYARPAER